MEKENIEISKNEENNKVSKKNKRTKILTISLISVLVLALAITLMVVLLTPKNYYKINTNSTEYLDIILNKSEATAGEEVVVKTITKEGYEVLSIYYIENESSTMVEIHNNKFKMPSEDICIYAKLQAITYTITYNLDGGQISEQKENYTVENESFTLPIPEKSNYEFLGWTWDRQEEPQKEVTIEKGSTGNKVYTANWQQIDISISVNEDIENYVNVEKKQVEENGKVVAIEVSIKNLSNESYIITDNNIYDLNNLFYTVWNEEKTKIINNTFTIKLPCENITIDGYRRLDNFEFSENTITKYKGNEENLVLPSSYSTLTIDETNYFIDGDEFEITGIKDYASFSSESITSVRIPNSIKNIGSLVFIFCDNLTEVYYDGSVEEWGSIEFNSESSNPMYNGAKLFIKDSNEYELLTEAALTKNVKQYAFYGCISLKSLSLCEGVESVENSSFYNCKNLFNIEMSNSVTNIASNAFFGCDSLVSVSFSSYLTSINSFAFSGCSNLTTISLPPTLTNIGSYAFFGCSKLESLTIPSSVATINNKVFANCSSLKDLTILGATSIGESAFSDCSNLTKIHLPLNLTSIGESAFANSSNLTKISLPSSLTNIGSSAFSNSGLTSVKIPDGVTSLSSYAFSGCSSLKSVELGTGVKNIFSHAFDGCGQLASIKIPNNITNIVRKAFFNCSSLRNVVIDSEEIYKKLTSDTSCGSLIQNATRIEVLKTIVDKEGNTNTFLNDTNNYTKAISNDRQNYTYIKN